MIARILHGSAACLAGSLPDTHWFSASVLGPFSYHAPFDCRAGACGVCCLRVGSTDVSLVATRSHPSGRVGRECHRCTHCADPVWTCPRLRNCAVSGSGLHVVVCGSDWESGTVSRGRVFGSRYKAWLGVPFAATTGGANRFMPPKPAQSWTAPFNATWWGPGCYQTHHNADVPKVLSEDCLNLNVFIANNGSSASVDTQLPVMVFFYGGCVSVSAELAAGAWSLDDNVSPPPLCQVFRRRL